MADTPGPSFEGLYRETVFDHFRNPRGRKPLASADVSNEGLNPVCGDEVKIALHFEGDRVKDVSVTGRGCAISTASGSMLAELIPGKSIAEVEELVGAVKGMMHDAGIPEGLDMGDLHALEGVKQFPIRIKCALLSWVTLNDAIEAWKHGGARLVKPSSSEEEGKGGFTL
ncbi:MAG TPA: SUF system NifU family Fe-S cluster assembly protein [Planctomycetota bacterium]|nr:SUF system NifU family Fe-S cluster assembly protein [Planctomycetota bacterium]